MTFRRRNDDPDLSIVAAVSEDLVLWDSGPAALLTVSAVDQGDGYDLVTVKEVAAVPPRKRNFGRVFVHRAAP